MSVNQNKTTLLGTIIILVMFFAIGISAQSPAAVNGLTSKADSTSETKETSPEKKSVPSAEDKDSTSGTGAVSKVKPPPDTRTATGDGERKAANKPVHARQPAVLSDKWQFQFTPYVWLPGLHGTAGIGNRTTEVNESFSKIFQALDFVFMGTFEARKGRWISLTDVEYVAVSDDKAMPGPLFSSARAKLKDFLVDPVGGYRVYANPDKGSFVDVLAGVRILHLHTDLNFNAGILPAVELQASRNWADGIVGLRGRLPLSEKIYLTGRGDLGGGGSKFTYQIFGGVGYNVNEKIVLIFGYRLLNINYNQNNFLYDLTQRGPILGLGFRF